MKIFWNGKNQNWDGWVGTANATSVLCRPPNLFKCLKLPVSFLHVLPYKHQILDCENISDHCLKKEKKNLPSTFPVNQLVAKFILVSVRGLFLAR